jgi:uncharacterized protein YaiI (UPF0178 family)
LLLDAGVDAESANPEGQTALMAVARTGNLDAAELLIKAGADVIGPTGRAHTQDSIGMALATRNLMEDLRSAGETTRGPKPFAPRDRSNFLSALDVAINRLKRSGHATG